MSSFFPTVNAGIAAIAAVNKAKALENLTIIVDRFEIGSVKLFFDKHEI
jgi:hypothetical protein